MKQEFAFLLTQTALLLTACLSLAAPQEKPNIVIIVADDLGWKDTGYHGGDIPTPNIDKLAEEGVRLENFHVAPLCSPTRAGLMTGRWPIRYGMGESVITPWRKWGLPTTENTIADMLGKAGYKTRAAVGKWHLGHHKKELLPLSRGFTSFYGHYNGAFDYFTHRREGELDWHRNEETSLDKGYSTDLIGREAAKIIAGSESNSPFFLYVPFNAPHDPMQAKETDLRKYKSIKNKNRRIYAAMVDSMDQAVGRILKAIDEKGIKDNTFILFFSDNGGITRWADNGSWRAGKGTVYEGGIRTPAVVCWPGGIQAGRVENTLTGYIDIYPTLKAVASHSMDDPNPVDGRNILGILQGKAKAEERDWFSYIAQGKPDQMALTAGDWKLVVAGKSVLDDDPPLELFHLKEDPAESNNLAAANPNKATAMLDRLRRHRRLKIKGIPDFREGKTEFVAPKDWKITR
ncbi:MAG: arylsulfatase [Akkermansiaceae bacterium]|jgi:arylsulfatase B|nr:arylsulfatase [Akkermansiaceae bacterium]